MQKIKQFFTNEKGKDVLVVIIVIFVGLGCFVLGKLSVVNEPQNSQIRPLGPDNGILVPIDNPQTSSNSSLKSTKVNSADVAGKNFFASSKGSKYYPMNCTAGQNIKIENRIYFVTEKEAEAAGYTRSSSCA